MTLQLVSEARPIPWDQLSIFEQRLIDEADAWIKNVAEDAMIEKPGVDEIEKHRTGRVLFIDGKRGAGKTSLLLTLLDRWRSKELYYPTLFTREGTDGPCGGKSGDRTGRGRPEDRLSGVEGTG